MTEHGWCQADNNRLYPLQLLNAIWKTIYYAAANKNVDKNISGIYDVE